MHLSDLWVWLFWTWTISEVALVIVTHTRSGQGKLADRGSIFVLWSVILVSISACDPLARLLPMLRFDGSPWLKPLTVILILAGLAVRWSAILSLGRSFSVNVAIQRSQTVYRSGLYRIVRHPSYLGMIIIFLAIGLRSRNVAGLLVMLLAPAAALVYRIHVEERALRDAFGAEYIAYCRTTKSLLPGIY